MYKNVHYITAGAGAGKTTTLVNIIADLVQNRQAEPQRMILTTFTDAAATEFRERSKAKLPAARAVEMNAAQMGTLHSLASKYIHRYWYLLGISPSVKPVSQSVSRILMNRSLADLVKGEQYDLLKKYVETFGLSKVQDGYDYDFWKDTLNKLFGAMRRYGFGPERIPEFKEKTLSLIRETYGMDGNAELLDMSRPFLEPYLGYDSVVENHGTDPGKDTYRKNCQQVARILALSPLSITVKDLKDLEAMGWGRDIAFDKKFAEKGRYTDEIKASKQALIEAVKSLCENLVPKEYKMIGDVAELLFDLLADWMRAYETIKKESGVIDFADMEGLFLRLLGMPEVLEDIHQSVDYLFVDEFQDSNPIQARIYDIISNHIKQSWFVGDRKQAIYGFSGSDSGLIAALMGDFPKVEEDAGSFTGFKKDISGNSSQVLGESHRSVPALVRAANAVFVPAFAEGGLEGDRIPKEQVLLEPDGKNHDKSWDSLYHVDLQGDNNTEIADALATFVCRMCESEAFKKAEYNVSDIAILARSRTQVNAIGDALIKKNLPTAFVDPVGFRNTPEVSLLTAILRLSEGVDEAKSRAEIRKILQNEDLAGLAKRVADGCNTLDDLPGLEAFAKSIRHHSVPDRVNEIIARFDLYGVCGHWGNPDSRRGHLNLVRQAADEYADKSQMLGAPADVRGFLSFLDDFKPETRFDNTAEGIKVLTYHKSKGLEWKIVILYALDEYKEVTSISGVTVLGDPTCPDGILAVPQIPDKTWAQNCVERSAEAKTILEQKRAAQEGEEKRLLYVGFTRAKEAVVTVSKDTEPGVLTRLCPTVGSRETTLPDGDKVDIWGIPGVVSHYAAFTADPDAVSTEVAEAMRYKDTGFFLSAERLKTDIMVKYHSPSCWRDPAVQAAASVDTVKDFGSRTDIAHNHLDDNVFGDCIHHIFAACAPGSHEQNMAVAARTLKAFGIDDADAPAKAVGCIETFYDWLTEAYGPYMAVEHELPVRYTDDNGRVFSGDVDLIWQTQNGCVLVDYKTFPGSRGDLFNKESEHWAGGYASQLHVYAEALSRDGRGAPLACLLYYPVEGLVLSVK